MFKATVIKVHEDGSIEVKWNDGEDKDSETFIKAQLVKKYVSKWNSNSQETIKNENCTEMEVKKITGHRVRKYLPGDPKAWQQEWEFQVTFKDGSTQWVNDSKCNCEQKISEYLNKEAPHIRTAYIICRVSTKAQTGCTSTSLKGQETEVRRALTSHISPSSSGYQRVRVYKISSSAYKRIPQIMKQLGNVLRRGDALWVWRVDRLSRNIINFLHWLETLNKKGIDIVAYSEQLTYKNQRLDFIQKIVDAQKEAASLGERIKMSYRQKRQRGDEHVGGLAYGSSYARILNVDGTINHKKVVPNSEEQVIIERIMASSNNQDIVDKLNKEGCKKQGKLWNRLMVARIRKKYKKASSSMRQKGWRYR